MTSLRTRIGGGDAVLAPLVLNPLMAKLAERAGFPALYLGGGSTGYSKVVLEANLNISELCQAGLDIKAVCPLPLILDGACGFGDPMHQHRTIGMAEAAGFAAIEIEDQILPKRAHHHVGIEHMVSAELMAAKVREAAAARRSRDFLIVARTNAVRQTGMDDALRRLEAYRRAGADVLLAIARTPEEARHLGERLGPPLMHLTAAGGLAGFGIGPAEMAGYGYRIIADATTPFLAAYDGMARCYAALAAGFADRGHDAGRLKALDQDMKAAIGLDAMLRIEKATVER
ncbi:MAG: isocitrate lyase/PEP mutase family protein [Alphaproteobacteria bacterium]|nr:isocitrate lyase/PEP mutase family protein [Alphaproteobacteria bacterium]